MTAPRHVSLIDGSGFIFRAFHALPPMTRPDGTPVNAVYGFVSMLMKLLAENRADCMVVVFDASRQTFRSEIYPQYKAHRPEPPEDLRPQFSLIRQAARSFGLPAIEREGFEADDLIATYAKQAIAQGATVTIVSSDKDLMQLVQEGVSMWDPMKAKTIGTSEVVEKFGVPPDKVVDVQALAGDASDNVPGVPGIGLKTAAQLIGEYGDLENLLAHADQIKQTKRRETLIAHAQEARISKELVQLKDDVPDLDPLESFPLTPPDPQILAAFLQENGFKSLLTRLNLSAPPPEASTTAPPAPRQEYELILDLAALDRWILDAKSQGFVAIDTETTGLDPRICQLVGVSLAVRSGRACYIPLRHGDDTAQSTLDLGGQDSSARTVLVPYQQALERLKDLCEDPAVLKIGHNIKYDLQVLQACKISVAPIDDTMVMSYVSAAGRHGHGLDELAERHFHHTTISYTELCGSGKNAITFDKVPLDKALAYAAEDADFTLRLHELLRGSLMADHLVAVYERLERPLIAVIAAMEQAGVKIDAARLRSLSADFAHRLTELEHTIHHLAGHSFNIASPKQLGEILFDEMKLPGAKKTKTGAYATGADILEDLAAQGHALPARVLEWRALAKLKSTYTDALVEQINPRTGRVHSSFSLAATTTGRLSSSDPNLQNIPVRTEEGRKIRQAFIAETGHKLISADYSQIELRLLAHVAGIENLRHAFAEGADIHAITASQVFSVPLEGLDPALRRRAKAINFGIIYGISAWGLAAQLAIPQTEAKHYIDTYFQRYPEIRAYMEATKDQARQQGFVTTPFGRRVHVAGIADKNPALRNFAERAAINAPIQGGAADIIKRAMIRLPDALRQAGLNGRMILQVHDELIFEVPEAETTASIAIIRAVMEQVAQLSVPLIVDIGHGDNWDEAH